MHQHFRTISLDALATTPFVVVTDITGFYDNIDIGRLQSDLRDVGANDADVQLLGICLRKWSEPRQRGVPQGYSASDILAKLFLGSVDSSLRHDGTRHLRYVDDIRVFCSTRRDAKLAIRRLSELLHQRGLSLQSEKTKIKARADAQPEFEGAGRVLGALEKQLDRDVRANKPSADYVTVAELFAALRKREGPAPEVLEQAFRENFSASEGARFDKSLFHFLLARLAAAGSRVAIPYSLASVRDRPEETEWALKYFAEVEMSLADLDAVISHMESADAIYDYQLYQLIRWCVDCEIVSERVLRLARRWSFDRNRERWLRDYAITYAGRYGDRSDLEQIENQYSQATGDLERATIVAALARVETSRRNAFLARSRKDGQLVERACDLVKMAG